VPGTDNPASKTEEARANLPKIRLNSLRATSPCQLERTRPLEATGRHQRLVNRNIPMGGKTQKPAKDHRSLVDRRGSVSSKETRKSDTVWAERPITEKRHHPRKNLQQIHIRGNVGNADRTNTQSRGFSKTPQGPRGTVPCGNRLGKKTQRQRLHLTKAPVKIEIEPPQGGYYEGREC